MAVFSNNMYGYASTGTSITYLPDYQSAMSSYIVYGSDPSPLSLQPPPKKKPAAHFDGDNVAWLRDRVSDMRVALT